MRNRSVAPWNVVAAAWVAEETQWLKGALEVTIDAMSAASEGLRIVRLNTTPAAVAATHSSAR
jgi:hypothetical protein